MSHKICISSPRLKATVVLPQPRSETKVQAKLSPSLLFFLLLLLVDSSPTAMFAQREVEELPTRTEAFSGQLSRRGRDFLTAVCDPQMMKCPFCGEAEQ